ncbi:hypothetical protein GA0115246_111101, partial [Streptomyces sp. SolWspMP-sol7th]
MLPRTRSETDSAGATIASVSGLASAAATGIEAPARRSSGTVITLPPTPRNEATAPIGSPRPVGSACRRPATVRAGRRKPGRASRSTTVTPTYATKPQRSTGPGANRPATAPS